jgi:hypothetical protein
MTDKRTMRRALQAYRVYLVIAVAGAFLGGWFARGFFGVLP